MFIWFGKDRNISVVEVIVILSGFIFIVFGILGLAGVRPPKGVTWQYWAFDTSAVLFLGGSVILVRRKYRKDVLTDWLTGEFGVPYEFAGVHLVPIVSPLPVQPNGPLRYAVFYQNRFNANSQIEVRLGPSPKFIDCGDLPTAEWKIEAGRGEVGLVWRDFSSTLGLTPGVAKLEFTASGRRGWGREVRFRAGHLISNRERDQARMIAMIAGGGVLVTDQETLSIPISDDSVEMSLPKITEGRLLIWLPGMSIQESEEAMTRAKSLARIETRDAFSGGKPG